METQYESFCSGKLCEGCKKCLKGRKLVLFIGGVCSRDCEYCPLSKRRKNVDTIFANERECKTIYDVFDEVRLSGASGCGITGGDPLHYFDRTIEYASKLKQKFGKKFHIHIYLSTKLVTREKIEKLSEVVDEIRFHPEININPEEIKKVSYGREFFDKENVGMEIPLFPDKEKETFALIDAMLPHIRFLNLNELEIGDTNFDWIKKNYEMSEDGYTAIGSVELGKKIIEKFGHKLNIHVCTARTKNWYQYRNRMKNYKPIKFGKMTNDGTVIYFTTKDMKVRDMLREKDLFFDRGKEQFIINPTQVANVHKKVEVLRIEECPTFDRDIIESEVF